MLELQWYDTLAAFVNMTVTRGESCEYAGLWQTCGNLSLGHMSTGTANFPSVKKLIPLKRNLETLLKNEKDYLLQVDRV